MPCDKARRLLFGVAREYGIEKDVLTERVYSEFGKSSISELTDRETYMLVDVIKGKKTHIRKRIPNRLSPPQHNLILKLASALGWDDNPKRLQGFIKKYAKVDAVDWLTPQQASRVIEGLKKMVERNAANG